MNLKKNNWVGKKILVIDDDKEIGSLLRTILTGEGYLVKTSTSAEEGLSLMKDFSPNVILCDIKLPKMSGFDFLDKIQDFDDIFDIIMITGHGEINDAVNAIQKGAFDYVTKPFSAEKIVITIDKALSTQHLQGEVRRLKSLLNKDNQKLVGNSVQMQRVLRYIDLIAPTDLNVLVRGSNGTGKKLAANLIHSQSNRKNKKFVYVDCESIPEALMDVTLYGYEVGGYIGSDISKKGKFEQADGGTIFLDGVTGLSLKSQAKLLQFLNSKTITRLDAEEDIKLDVRVITSSSDDFRKLFKENRFRTDLFYKINEFELLIPDLKVRSGDIMLLADFFLNLANKRFNKNIKSISSEVYSLLERYSWPGNVAELKNVINRAVLICNGNMLKLEHIELQNMVRRENILNIKGFDLLEAKEIIEEELIKEALNRADYNKSKAAELLGYSRKTLYTKLEKHGLE